MSLDRDTVKSYVDILSLSKHLGIELKRQGAEYLGLCPFHEDKKPSFSVNVSENLFHCFGCGKGGDVIRLVELKEKLSFSASLDYLSWVYGLNGKAKPSSLAEKKTEPKPEASPYSEQDILKARRKAVDHYHKVLLTHEGAREYLKRRGLDSPKLIEDFRLGYCDRSFSRSLSKQDKDLYVLAGILREGSKAEHLGGCVTIPIIEGDEVRGLYGRRIRNRESEGYPSHLYLKGAHCAVFNEEAFLGEKLILCESLIDALSFYSVGITNVTSSYGTNGFTKAHKEKLRDSKVKEILIAYDTDEAGDKGADSLLEELKPLDLKISRVRLPDNEDVNSFSLLQPEENRKDSLVSLLDKAETLYIPLLKTPAKENKALPSKKEKPKSYEVKITERELLVSFKDRSYRVRGILSNTGLEHMKVNLRANYGSRFHLDVLDLYSAKQRLQFIRECESILELSKEVLLKDFSKLLSEVEKAHDSYLAGSYEKDEAYVMSEREQREALAFLEDPKLMKRLLEDFMALGYVGEDLNKIVAYLCCISRFLDDPLSVMIVSRSAAGKSSLQDAVLKFVPASDQVKFTAMTGQSLFYMEEGSLEHKVLAISENEGAHSASYALKTLDSEGELRIASTGKDPVSGKMRTHDYRVKGPVALLLTTTETELDYELANRLITLTVDEDCKQTKAIHEQQRKEETLEGLSLKAKRKKITLKHQNVSRLLKKVSVVNPYAEKLSFMTSRLRSRRDHKKYLRLIKSITFLFQYQRPIKHHEGIEYIESTLEDITLANQLAKEILVKSLDELSPPSRRLLMIIKEYVRKKEAEQGDFVHFSRKELRDFSGWDHWQIRDHIKQLEELEFIKAVRGKKGQSYEYELCVLDEKELDICLADTNGLMG